MDEKLLTKQLDTWIWIMGEILAEEICVCVWLLVHLFIHHSFSEGLLIPLLCVKYSARQWG